MSLLSRRILLTLDHAIQPKPPLMPNINMMLITITTAPPRPPAETDAPIPPEPASLAADPLEAFSSRFI